MSGGSARDRWRRLRAALALALLRVLRFVLAPLGWRGAQRLGAGVGWLAWRLARKQRRWTLEHLAIAFPDLDAGARKRLGGACFRHLGITLLECVRLMGADCDEVRRRVRVEGWQGVESLRAAGRQILILTGHVGNWELLAATIACCGLPMSVVARPAHDERLDSVLVGLRARYGNRTIGRGAAGGARELLSALRGGGAIGILIDQDTRVDGTWVPFFGRPAFTPLGAAQIGRRAGVAVVPTFIERLADGSHLARYEPALELPEDPVAATALMTARIEAQVRRVPEQWVWMHRRWRRQPPSEATVTM
jgi:Kdo2-lipid IVA lauroyltransferase/acyltransferase